MKTIILPVLATVFAPLVLARINEIPDISSQALKQAVARRQATLLDISGPADFKAGHIPGAIDFVREKDNLEAYLPADPNRLIVVYCHHEACPDYTTAAAAAVDLGHTHVEFYQPGLTGWMKAGGLVEKGEGPEPR
ncbi:MAG TPA: rhodanese-like domain-containing protein [Opitutaceae bacterium]|nr:rhodanese-like domain-containing protein [Opitutaceae bacterium]